jgi:hypothetical protein
MEAVASAIVLVPAPCLGPATWRATAGASLRALP